jgi:hypothetical protein
VVEGKLFPRFESDDLIPANFQLDSALLAAETTMCFDKMLGRISRFILPTTRRNVCRMPKRSTSDSGEAGCELGRDVAGSVLIRFAPQ